MRYATMQYDQRDVLADSSARRPGSDGKRGPGNLLPYFFVRIMN